MKKIYVPGSKSITNRALLLAALSGRTVVLKNVLDSDDSRYMQAALEQFGVQIQAPGKKVLKVTSPQKLKTNKSELFIGNAGTAARFLSALSLVVEGDYWLTGVDRMQKRPQKDLMQALRSLGVDIRCTKNEGFLPAKFSSRSTLKTYQGRPCVKISGKASSQFLSGLMLVAPCLESGLEIKITDSIPSRPYVEMTVEMLKIWGAKVEVSADFLSFTIHPGFNAPAEYNIPSDMSSASYPLAWSVLRGVPVSIENFGTQTLQGDERFIEVIKATGAKVTHHGEKLQVEPQFELQPIGDRNYETMPDVSMTGMVLAAFCPGASKFTGLESLRVKECDRILAMEQLQQLAVDLKVEEDVITITGAPSIKVLDEEVCINSYDDHRIAMCFGLVKAAIDLGADPYQVSIIKITDPECVGKTWPGFWLSLAEWENQLRLVSGVVVSRNRGSSPGKGKDDIEYLIVKKPRKHNAWQFPQGGVDAGETGRQAAERELKEECGASLSIKIKGERSVGEYTYFFPKDFKRHEARVIGAKVCFFKADYIEGRVEVDGKEIIDHKWVTPEAFEAYFEADYLQIVKEFL